DVVGEFVGGEVLGPIEHQVLKEVRESGPAGDLILRAHVIPNLHVDHRRVVALHNQRPQAVIEFHFVDFGVRKLDGGTGGSTPILAVPPHWRDARGASGRLEKQPERAGREHETSEGAPAEWEMHCQRASVLNSRDECLHARSSQGMILAQHASWVFGSSGSRWAARWGPLSCRSSVPRLRYSSPGLSNESGSCRKMS